MADQKKDPIITVQREDIHINPLPFGQYRFAFNPPRRHEGISKTNPELKEDAEVVFGCVISTLNRAGANPLYSYHAYQLTFPEAVIEEAKGKSRIRIFTITNKEAGSHAKSFLDKEKVVRVARCRIPESDNAIMLMDNYLHDFSGNSWMAGNTQHISTSGVKNTQSLSTLGGSYRWVCTEEGTAHKWIYDDEDQRWWLVVTPTCLEGYYEFVEEDSPMDGGGPGGGGDDPSPPCDDPTQLCLDGSGGSSGLDEDEIREDEVKRLLEDDAFALLDIPCEEIPKWQELAQYEIPQSVLDRLVNTDALSGSFIQKLEDASGAVVNMDKFSVTVPGNDIPNGWSAEQYLDHIRTNLNSYIVNSISIFEPYPGLNDKDKWNGPNPLGSMFSIQLTPEILGLQGDLEDGTVIATGFGSSFWIFSTLYTTDDGFHPVSGNRLFGFTDNGDGTYSFYTRGVDRLSTSFYDWGNWLSGGLAFSTADELWSSFQEKIKDEIGSSATLDSTTYRPDYNKVEGVLNGTESLTTLGCN